MPAIPLTLSWLIVGFPVIGFLIQALFGKQVIDSLGERRGKWIMGTLAVLPIVLSFLLGLAYTLQIADMPSARGVVVPLAEWITISTLRVPFEFLLDPLSLTMVLIITGVGALIHVYATGYMAEDRDYTRFFTYMNLFVAAMLVLVLANNLVLLFIGWEGVGLCSYLLIGFWYKDLANTRAANKAFIVNRIGDWGMMLGMFLLVTLILSGHNGANSIDGRALSYDVLIPNIANQLRSSPDLLTIVGLLLFVGAMGKSAQFPLYLWLPDAMAGPTPVSALIHAATMVTSGVFLLNRLSIIYQLSPVASAVVAIVGAFTALFAALIAFGQTDIKRVLAYSTVSQLGFMFIACGSGAYWAGMFHVTTHAFFKALLFLGAGAVIYAMAHNQDMRNYGNLRKYLPITFWTMLIGTLAIAGVPGLSGFFSKEAILNSGLGGNLAVASGVNFGYWAGMVGLFVAALTAIYMIRLTALTFFNNEERWRQLPAPDDHHAPYLAPVVDSPIAANVEDENRFYYTAQELRAAAKEESEDGHHDLGPDHQPHEVPPSMSLPLVVLAILSAGAGGILVSGGRFQKWLSSSTPMISPAHEHHVGWLMPASFAAAVLGLAAGAFVYWRSLPEREGWDLAKWNPFRRAAMNQFGYDSTMTLVSKEGGRGVATALWKGFDQGLIEGVLMGSAGLTSIFARSLRHLQTGYVRFYALMMLVGVIGILGYFAMALNAGGVR